MVPCYIRDEEEGDTGGLQVGVPAECVMPYLPAVHGHGNHEPYAHHARLAHRATSATCYTAQSPRRPASHLLHPLCPIGRSNRAYELAAQHDTLAGVHGMAGMHPSMDPRWCAVC